ncbi:MAG TPA: phosphate ABC transporter ATP-binding protein, partial [Desulfocapsa sulfexigens]|nr:phosphate ABC transporter ATP-binding protein [Desulfocapsa sulfexigens]
MESMTAALTVGDISFSGADSVASESVREEEKVDRENRQTVGVQFVDDARMTCRDVNVYYGAKQAIRDVSIDIGRNEVLAMIGPSGCGKS